MSTMWEYMELPQGARILKVWGEEEYLTVPERLGGFPVTEIGPYAFSAAELPRRFHVKEELQRLAAVEGDSLAEEPAIAGRRRKTPVDGGRLRGIRLPASLQVIGDYAFYGCRELKTIAFFETPLRIGSGAFMGCAGVEGLEFTETGKGGGKSSLYQMLSELRYAMEITVKRGDGRTALMVPEYYESSVENIPARILELHYHGTGYRYRQCFRSGAVDYREYDGLFGLAESQEPPEVLARLAYDRLRYPEGLSEEAKKIYLQWFSVNVREAGEYFLKRDELPAVRLICEAGGFDGQAKGNGGRRAAEEKRKVVADGAGDFYMASMGENILGEEEGVSGGADLFSVIKTDEEPPRAALEILIEMAGRMGRTEIVSVLMDYRHRKEGGRKKKVFSL